MIDTGMWDELLSNFGWQMGKKKGNGKINYGGFSWQSARTRAREMKLKAPPVWLTIEMMDRYIDFVNQICSRTTYAATITLGCI